MDDVAAQSYSGAALRILRRSDLADIPLAPAEAIALVEQAYLALGAGLSVFPRKLTVKHPAGESVSYAMLGRDGHRHLVGIKTSYTHRPQSRNGFKRYCTTITLYDDVRGTPVAMMDASRAGALRTAAVSALLVRETMRMQARTVLVIGSGMQGRHTLPHVLTANPQLDRLLLYGTHPAGIAGVRSELRQHFPSATVELVDDPYPAAVQADVVVAAAGPATVVALESSDLAPGSTAVLVGYGLAPSALADADRVLATSASQMALTGTDMAGPDGTLRLPHTELADVLAGRQAARLEESDKVFVFSSGIVLADIAVAATLAERAIALGRGEVVSLWD